MSFPSELEAFRAYAKRYPDKCVLLVDTSDTLESGVPNAIRVYQEMHDQGLPIRPAIRLDSGDLAKLSKAAYRMMLDAGLEDPLIVASNDLDDDLIADLKRQDAKINAWGVGTHLITSKGCPAFGGVYKLVAVKEEGKWQPRIKVSANMDKATDPGRKQVYRIFDKYDHPLGDMLCMEEEPKPTGETLVGRMRAWPDRLCTIKNVARAEPLLHMVFEKGQPCFSPAEISRIRDFSASQRVALPEEYQRLKNPQIYQVCLSESLGNLKHDMFADTR
jgi:nicotinate phosphoribosyltransferase